MPLLPPRAALVSLSLLACEPAEPRPDLPASDAVTDLGDALAQGSLELGTGQTDWRAIPPSGGRLELIHGPQGGYHLFGRVRFQGLPPDVYVTFRVTPEAGGPDLQESIALRRQSGRGLAPTTDRRWESSVAELVVLTAIRGPTDVVGGSFLFEATVRHVSSPLSLHTSRLITIVDDDP